MATSSKRKSLTISEKLKIIAEIEAGRKTQAQVTRENALAKQTVQKIWATREKIKEDAKSFNLNYKKVRKCEFPTIDSALTQWFNIQRARNITLSGPIIKEKAQEIANKLQIPDFKGSEGWMEGWKKRHGIVFKIAAGEGASVDITGVDEWIRDVWTTVSAGYSPSDIYNADETGLFYRLMPNKTLEYKGRECHGGKQSKERLTVLLCANADGSDKLKPVVIGKSARPRCFKNIRDLRTLPVTYESNKKAWMTAVIFEKWLKEVNNQMKLANRKILMVLDNCTAHVAVNLQLDCVKIVFLPPNATSLVQPLDRGIINSLKIKYRTRMIKKIILKLDSGEEAKVDVLDAIHGISSSWNDVTSSCISNCFTNSKLIKATAEREDEIVEVEEHGFGDLYIDNFNLTEYAQVDANLILSEEEIIVSSSEGNNNVLPELSDEDDDEASDVEDERVIVSNKHALKLVEDLKYYFTCAGDESATKELRNLEEKILSKTFNSLSQTSITKYFSKS